MKGHHLFLLITLTLAFSGLIIEILHYIYEEDKKTDCYQARLIITAYEDCRDDKNCTLNMQDRVDYDQALDVMEFTQCQ